MKTFRAIAPLSGVTVGDTSIEFGLGIVLCKLPARIKEDPAIRNWVRREQAELLKNAEGCFMVEYLAQEYVAGGGFPPEWKQERFNEGLAQANFSLWLAQRTGTSLMFAAHELIDETPKGAFIYDLQFVYQRDVGRSLSEEDILKASALHKAAVSLPVHGTVWTALFLSWKASIEKESDFRYLFFWLALDALFGAAQESRFRTSQRIALFLNDDDHSIDAVFKEAQKGYDYRSRVAHGSLNFKAKDEEADRLIDQTEELVQRALVRILNDPQHIEAFDTKRTEFLESLWT